MAAPMVYFKFTRSLLNLSSKYKSKSTMNVDQRYFNSNRCSVTRIKRATYARVYPTLLVQSDGSTVRIKYEVPQGIIRLPVDVNQLTEEERLMHTAKHKKKQVIVVEDELDDGFNVEKYSHLWKK